LVIASIVLLGTVIRVPQLFHTLFEPHSFRQTQTAFIAKQYALNGIDVLTTPLPVFGTGSNVPMEFPLFQAIASLGVSAGLTPDGASRLLGLLAFQATAVLLAVLLLRRHGRVVAIMAVGLFELLPFGLFWGAASLIDFFAVSLAMLMVYALGRWFERGSPWFLVIGAIASVLAFLVKATTAPAWGFLLLAIAVIVVREAGWRASRRRIVVGMLLGPGAGLIAAVAWTAFADSVKSRNELTVFLTSSALREWNFGTIPQRLELSNYLSVVGRVTNEIVGPLLVPLILGVAGTLLLRGRGQRIDTLGWILAAASGPLVFFNLYVIHSYYLIAIYPALTAVCAIGIVWAIRLIPGVRGRWATVAVSALTATALIVGLGATSGRSSVQGFLSSPPPSGPAIDIRDNTEKGSRIIVIGCDWDPTYLYYAQREGLMFRGVDAGSVWETQSAADYDYLFRCAPTLDPLSFLPVGVSAEESPIPGLFVVRSG